MDDRRLGTDSLASQKMSALYELLDVPISGMIGSGHLDSYSEKQLNNLANSNIFMDEIIRRTMNQRTSITTVAEFMKISVPDEFQIATVQAHF